MNLANVVLNEKAWSRAGLFQGLEPAALQHLRASARSVRSAVGDTLFHQGDPPDHLYLVTSGVVKLSQVTANGTQHVLRLMALGDIIGCVAVFNRLAYPVTATIENDATLMFWPEPVFRHLTEDHPRLMANALQLVGTRTQEFVARLGEINGASAEQKVAKAVLRLARQAGTKEADGVRIVMTRQDLADMTGITYFTISRILSDWRRRSLIEASRRDLYIKSPHALFQIAEGI